MNVKVLDSRVAGTRFKIGPVRLSHLHVFEPYKFDSTDDKPGKYSACILIPKDEPDVVAAVKKAIRAAYEAGVITKWQGKRPPIGEYAPMVDGDSLNKNGDERGAECHGHWFLNAKSGTAPLVVDARRVPIAPETGDSVIYSGSWGNAVISFAAYDSNGSRGISVYLEGIQKVKDDAKFGGGINADVFDVLESESEEDIF